MNIKKLMKQAEQMQAQMQERVAAVEVEATSGGGMVTVKMSGTKELVAITIDPEVVDPEDAGMLADLVLAAVNEAGRKVDEEIQGSLGGLTGGMPGLPGIPGL